jgi:hypothetical protein
MSVLATRFSHNSNVLRSETPLAEDQLRRVAPSLFAQNAHESRSARYAYIPTIEILRGLQREGFQPFFAAQSRCRIEGKSDFTKHMLRLRHAAQVNTKGEANEVILINSHDGTSSYQMLAGQFRFVCHNGTVCGDIVQDVRVKHSGRAREEVVAGAFEVLDGVTRVVESTEEMKALPMDQGEQIAFARAALALRYGDPAKPAPVQPEQVIQPRRFEDRGADLWTVFNRTQENLVRGGLHGVNARGQHTTTRSVSSIDADVKLNRALWILAEEMKRLKG